MNFPGGETMVLMVRDSNGRQIQYGDFLKRECSANNELHGEFSYYKVVNRGGFPVLEYVMSDPGYVLPPGYLATYLSDEYDAKAVLWASEDHMPSPCNRKLIVVSESDLPRKPLTEAEWFELRASRSVNS